MERTSDGRVERGESVAWQTEEVVPVGTSWNPVGVINGIDADSPDRCLCSRVSDYPGRDFEMRA